MAPALFRNFTISSISGSLAAFVNIVVPSAKHAANIMFSVAPTLGKSKCICVPSIFSALQIISPYSSFIFIPNFSNPFKCRSIGLEPISQPPGYEKLALLYFPIIAPANITEDLIFLIKFSGISYVFILLVSIIILLFFLVTFPPMSLIISNIVCTS